MKKIVLILSLIILGCQQKEQKPSSPATNDFVQLQDLNGNSFTLENLIEQNKGKLVYVDFWASWCVPCIQMMPHSKKIQEHYKNQDIEFIYVSVDRDATAWEKAHNKHQLGKQSYLSMNYPKAKLYQLREVSNIPRYMLYDKNGKIIDDNALRPNQPSLYQIIDNLLKVE